MFRKQEKRRKIQENRRLRQIQDNQQKRPSIVSKQDVSSIDFYCKIFRFISFLSILVEHRRRRSFT